MHRRVGSAHLGEHLLGRHADRPVRRPQQQRPPHPRSSGRRQTRPLPPASRRVQIQTDPRYTLCASGLPLTLRQAIVTTRFSQIQAPDAPILCERSGLALHRSLELECFNPRASCRTVIVKANRCLEFVEPVLDHLYGGMNEPELKIIDVFVCTLQKKFAQATGGVHYIETVWGLGYVLRDPAITDPPAHAA